MEGKNRSRLGIQMAILEVLSDEKTKPHLYTHILYATNMNTYALMGYLRELERKGWITIEPFAHSRVAKGHFVISEDGKVILHLYHQFVQAYESRDKTKRMLPSERNEW